MEHGDPTGWLALRSVEETGHRNDCELERQDLKPDTHEITIPSVHSITPINLSGLLCSRCPWERTLHFGQLHYLS